MQRGDFSFWFNLTIIDKVHNNAIEREAREQQSVVHCALMTM